MTTKLVVEKLTQEQQKIVEDNIGLVHKVINDRWNKVPELHDDFFQEGCIGLARATQMFNKDIGAFSTFAYKYINGHILRYYKYRESSIFKITAGTYEEARAENPLRLDATRYSDDGSSLSEVIRDPEEPFLEIDKKIDIELKNKKDREEIYDCITDEEYQFILDYTIAKRNSNIRGRMYTKEYRRYQNLCHKVRVIKRNKDQAKADAEKREIELDRLLKHYR